MKKFLWPSVIVIALAAVILSIVYGPAGPTEKIYVAVEGDGAIAVIDPARQKVIKKIDLNIEHDGGLLPYAPHNVQVSPDGRSVWVTANAGSHQDHNASLLIPSALAHGDEAETIENDEIIIIDPATDQISERLPLGRDLHLAHVVLAPNGNYAYATAQEAGKIYKINARALTVEKIIETPTGSEPHGLRVAPDSSTAYVAMLGSKSLGILDLENDTVTFVPLDGQAVQTGITPNGQKVIVSLYDKKQLAVYERGHVWKLSFIPLPADARGPIQMYPTIDSLFVYLADQGYYFDQPVGQLVYKIDLTTNQVVKTIKTGNGPHGIVISPNDRFVYVTNLLDGDVAIIDTATDEVVVKIPVGKEPNGISHWIGPILK